eukprot:350841-Chlamydomonas_euryale.AAC.1
MLRTLLAQRVWAAQKVWAAQRVWAARRVWAAQKVWAAQRVWAACLRFLQDWCASLWKLPPCLLPFPAQREDAPAAAPASATSPRRPRHNTRAQTASHTAAVQAPTHRWSMNTSGRAAPRARGTPVAGAVGRCCEEGRRDILDQGFLQAANDPLTITNRTNRTKKPSQAPKHHNSSRPKSGQPAAHSLSQPARHRTASH